MGGANRWCPYRSSQRVGGAPKSQAQHDGSWPRRGWLNDRYALSPFLTGRMFVRPNILRTLRRTMIRFLIELLVRRNMVRTVQTLLHSQLACNEMQASARTCGRRAADSMIENVG